MPSVRRSKAANPTIYDHAIENTEFYNDAIRQKVREGRSWEELFFELALEDLTQAADWKGEPAAGEKVIPRTQYREHSHRCNARLPTWHPSSGE
jgi:hypothetical protein